jgi:photosystem II stability/assembly factor-like uncharacterized protein
MSQPSSHRLLSRFDQLSRRQRVTLTVLAMLLVVVIVGTATLVIALPGGTSTAGTSPGSGTSAPTQPLTLVPLPAPAAPHVTPGQWMNAGPPFAQDVAFAPSAPTTAYACGSAGRGGKLALAISHDGGQTWTAQATSVSGQACALRVSPTLPDDVALGVAHCATTCGPTALAALYRSHDGGMTWTQALLAGSGFTLAFGWQGTTLLAATNTPQHPLAVSVAGGPFVRRDDIGRYPGSISAITATNGTLYAQLQAASGGEPLVVQSIDGGAIWTASSFADGMFPVNFAGTSADEQALIGLENGETVVVSRDGGQSWTHTPALPAGQTLAAPAFVARAPDGSLVALLQTADVSAPAFTLAQLAPGASAWQTFAAPPAHVAPHALAWDANGHPMALWAANSDPHAADPLWIYHF